MADEKEKQNAEEPQEPSKSPKKKRLLFLILGVILLAGVGAGGFFGYKTWAGSGEEKISEEELNKPPDFGEEIFIPAKPMSVNLADPRTYLRIQIAVEVPKDLEAEKKEELKSREVQIRDTLFTILNEKTANELMTREGKEKFEQDLLNKIKVFFDERHIRNIYITEWLIQ